MPRPGRIRFLSWTAALYDPVVGGMGFRRLWESVARRAGTPAGGLCLDVCTGTGGVAIALAHAGMRVVGVDLAGGMLARARHKADAESLGARVRFMRMDARRLAFSDDSFSLVTCAMALHEMGEEERRSVLRELRRVASERVLVADYRVPSTRWRRALFRFACFFEYVESADFEGFAAGDFRARLEGVGLEVETPWDVGSYRIWPCSVGAG